MNVLHLSLPSVIVINHLISLLHHIRISSTLFRACRPDCLSPSSIPSISVFSSRSSGILQILSSDNPHPRWVSLCYSLDFGSKPSYSVLPELQLVSSSAPSSPQSFSPSHNQSNGIDRNVPSMDLAVQLYRPTQAPPACSSHIHHQFN